MRRPDRIKKTNGKQIAVHWLFFDTESWVNKEEDGTETHTLHLGCAIYVRLKNNGEIKEKKEIYFETSKEFAQIIEDYALEKTTLYVCAWNVSYDFQITQILPMLVERGWEATYIYAKNNTVIINLKRGRQRLYFLDAQNWLRGKLAEWGKIVGIEKGETIINDTDIKRLKDYCLNDTRILMASVLHFIKFVYDNNLGNLMKTISSQALEAYRHRFMNYDIRLHNNEAVTKLEREAYGGGLVRIFHAGKLPDDEYRQLDINSMYAYIMGIQKYPVRLIAVRENITTDELKNIVKSMLCVADITVKPQEDMFRYKHKDTVIYPICEFRSCFTTPEIKELLRQNAIVKVHKVAVYKGAPLFREYVSFFWRMRRKAKKDGNIIYDQMAKQFLNSLYGKFGAKSTGFERYEDYDALPGRPTIVWEINEHKCRALFYIGEKCYREKIDEEAPLSFPAIAAHVTAYARMYLWDLIHLAGRENVFYVDTDSMIVNSDGYKRAKKKVAANILGYLKEEKIGIDGKTTTRCAVIWGRKLYRIGIKVVAKGVDRAYSFDLPDEAYRSTWQTLDYYLKHNCPQEYKVRHKKLNLQFTIHDGWLERDGKIRPFASIPKTFDKIPREMLR